MKEIEVALNYYKASLLDKELWSNFHQEKLFLSTSSALVFEPTQPPI
jgi:hypothetical protein